MIHHMDDLFGVKWLIASDCTPSAYIYLRGGDCSLPLCAAHLSIGAFVRAIDEKIMYAAIH
jgi:hypothetical protein